MTSFDRQTTSLENAYLRETELLSYSRQFALYPRKDLCAVLLFASLFLLLRPLVAQSDRDNDPALPAAFEQLDELQIGQPLNVLDPIEQAVAEARTDAKFRSDLEGQLLQVLQGDATDLAKDYVCRQLAIVGSDAALPALAGLLTNPRLAYMARYAVEGIGGSAARKTLRQTLNKTEGPQRVGVVISLGRLRDVDAVDAIATFLDGPDAQLREAALVALGRVGSVPSAQVLRSFFDKAPASLGDEIADALLAAAESLRQQAMFDQAEECYELLLSGDIQRTSANAYRGLIWTRPKQTPSKICEGLASDEVWKRQVAADCLLDLEKPDHVGAVASAVAALPAAGKIAAFSSLRHHRHAAIRQAALQTLRDSDIEVQTSALAALISSGTPEDVPILASLVATADDRDLRESAARTLRLMASDEVDRALVAWMNDAEQIDPALMRCALERRSAAIVPAFLRAAESQNSATRMEAFAALEIMATPDDVETLAALLCKTPPGQEREAASRAVWMACQRIMDPEKRRTLLLAALKDTDSAGRRAILPTLARIGGNEVLAAVEQAMRSDDAAMRDAGYRALANWPDASVADRLLEIAKTSNSEAYRVWALRAYARVIALPSERTLPETFDMLREAMNLAERIEDRELFVSRMATVRTPESLSLLLTLLDESELRPSATKAVFESAKGLSRSHPQQAREALERIQPLVTDPEIRQQLPKVLRDIKARQAK